MELPLAKVLSMRLFINVRIIGYVVVINL